MLYVHLIHPLFLRLNFSYNPKNLCSCVYFEGVVSIYNYIILYLNSSFDLTLFEPRWRKDLFRIYKKKLHRGKAQRLDCWTIIEPGQFINLFYWRMFHSMNMMSILCYFRFLQATPKDLKIKSRHVSYCGGNTGVKYC